VTAAVAVTFDNLGEVADLERGRPPSPEGLGRHHSVTRALPRILDRLAELELRATFFVEGLNAELYPHALAEIDAAGHEVAYHGWRHERWAELDPREEEELLRRGVAAFDELGLHPVGFRPPGGELAPSSLGALAATGFTYCSPAGEEAAARGGIAVLPFRWPLIDAFHYLPHFAERRCAELGAPDVLTPADLRTTVGAAVRETVERGGFIALLFHPFLLDDDERWATFSALLSEVRALREDGMATCAPLRDTACEVV
jgi:peptidoglycan/xylan/chitin deacetylase (PgdA/CDA1 family)